jgi:hypothetical protein
MIRRQEGGRAPTGHVNRIGAPSPEAYPVETQLALLRRDIEEIHHALHGDGKGRKGLVDQVEELVTVADRGRFSLRVALWLGGGIVAAATALAQFKQAIVGLFHQ